RREETEWASPRVHHRSCVAIRVGGGVAAFQTHLVTSQIAEFNEKLRIEFHAALRIGVQLHHPAPYAVRIELRIPRSVKRVREVNPSAVTADFHHLRPAVERRLRL